MSSVNTEALKSLGSEGTAYQFTGTNAALLERFENPFNLEQFQLTNGTSLNKVKITCPEFTSLCPKTGQPDFAVIVIEYTPRNWCVESKSLKLYLNTFRNVGEFHESCVARIAKDLIALTDPQQMLVRGEFTPRGGIPFWPEVNYWASSPGLLPEAE